MKYKICDNIEVTEVEDDNTIVCFDEDSGETHIMDESAAAVLKTVGYGMTVNEAAEQISKQFEADCDEIKKDITLFVNELIAKGIIVEDCM